MNNEIDGKIEFTYQFSSSHPKVVMTLTPESTLTDVLEAFDSFLRGAGYCFDGVIDLVNEDKREPEKEENNDEI